MDLSIEWIAAIAATAVLAVVCKLVSKKLNSDVDAMFDGMADMRTQRFFFAFDGQPEPISVTDANKRLKDNNGILVVEGTYNQRPVSVTLKTEDYLTKIEQDVTIGHSYSMPCASKIKARILNDSDDIEDSGDNLQTIDSENESITGIKILSDDESVCRKFLEEEQVQEYIAHLINSSKISEIMIDGDQIKLVDNEPKAGESFVRIKAIFEMQDYLANQLESV